MDSQLTQYRQCLQNASNLIKERGEALATAEKNYRIALSDKLQQLRAEKVQATLMDNLAKGDPKVAELRHTRDVANARYKSNLAAVEVYKTLLNSFNIIDF
jgi:hypothetical protein